MLEDPIVEEVRKVRLEHAEKFKFDLKAIFMDLKKQEEASRRKFVRLKPKPAAVIVSGT